MKEELCLGLEEALVYIRDLIPEPRTFPDSEIAVSLQIVRKEDKVVWRDSCAVFSSLSGSMYEARGSSLTGILGVLGFSGLARRSVSGSSLSSALNFPVVSDEGIVFGRSFLRFIGSGAGTFDISEVYFEKESSRTVSECTVWEDINERVSSLGTCLSSLGECGVEVLSFPGDKKLKFKVCWGFGDSYLRELFFETCYLGESVTKIRGALVHQDSGSRFVHPETNFKRHDVETTVKMLENMRSWIGNTDSDVSEIYPYHCSHSFVPSDPDTDYILPSSLRELWERHSRGITLGEFLEAVFSVSGDLSGGERSRLERGFGKVVVESGVQCSGCWGFPREACIGV